MGKSGFEFEFFANNGHEAVDMFTANPSLRRVARFLDE